MTEPAVFSRRTVAWLLAMGLLCFGAAAWLALDEKSDLEGLVVGTGAPSRSAIGHHTFVELLERAGIPVEVRRSASPEPVSPTELLVVLISPSFRFDPDTTESLRTARTVLIVLPKWIGTPDPERPEWIDAASLAPAVDVGTQLRELVPRAMVYRPDRTVEWEPEPFGVRPELVRPQLVLSRELRPVVASDRGMHVGELQRDGQRIWLVSDPDLLSNHGIGRGDNAVLVVSLVEALLPADGTVVIEDAVHAWLGRVLVAPPSLLRALLEPPFVVLTVQFAAAVPTLLLAATGRFGAPLPAPRALAFGHAALLDNMAMLLASGPHAREILRRYHDLVRHEVLRRIHAPFDESGADAATRLDRAGTARGSRLHYSTLRDAVTASRDRARTADSTAVAVGRDLHRWKGDILDGR